MKPLTDCMKTQSDYPLASRCRRGLHDFRRVDGDSHQYREDCLKCGHKNFWRVGAGGNNPHWLEAHARDALQPWGTDKVMFIAEYGLAHFKAIKPRQKDKSSYSDIIGEGKEDLRRSKRTVFL